MSFDLNANLKPAENPALSVGSGPIAVDVSSLSEVTFQYQPDNGVGPGTETGAPNNYNDQDITFNVKIPATSRVLFDKSYIRLEGIAFDITGGVVAGPVPYGVSIPWNPVAALLQTAEVQLNESSDMTEQLNQEIGHASNIKMMTRYSKDVMDRMSDFFFTPTIESRRDLNTGTGIAVASSGLSPESFARNLENLSSTEGGGIPVPHSKNIYLGDLFDSLRIPSAFFLQRFRMTLRPKASTNILFGDKEGLAAGGAHAMSVMRYFVTGARLFLTMVQLTENQLVVEKNKILSNAALLRESFSTFDARRDQHVPGKSYRDSNIKNMQAAVFMFPSNTTSETGTLASTPLGCNPYQYVYNNIPDAPLVTAYAGGIASYQHRYDGLNSPSQPLTVDPIRPETNTDLFHQYRLLTRRTSDREVALALKFTSSMGNHMVMGASPVLPIPKYDHCPYVLFCAQFYPLNAALHKNMAGADHEIITSGGGNAGIIIVRIRSSFMEIRGDTSVYMIH